MISRERRCKVCQKIFEGHSLYCSSRCWNKKRWAGTKFIFFRIFTDSEEYKFLERQEQKGTKMNDYVKRLLSWYTKKKLEKQNVGKE